MHRILGAACAAILVCSPAAFAAAQSAVDTSNGQARLQEAAQKTCNADLDHDHFNYSTMEECVSDTMSKMARAQHQQTADGKPAHTN